MDARTLSRVEDADVAVLDGTFWATEEIDGQAEVPYPPVRDALEVLPLAETDVYVTHLNHTNPLFDEGSPEYERLLDAGADVVERGQAFNLE